MAGRAEALSLLAAGAVVGAAGALLYSRNSSPNDAKMAILMLVAGEDETREMVGASVQDQINARRWSDL